ncbi:MAG: 4-hydroxy-tetrahydrodipicolinate synthase [Pseudomonadales bacterium]|jgi:4-hydroxy-tetrahydrodipicolinate synthase|nr:4-hydroxy-tetrahydrodipicolinate synthase [Pseudomonadales bacterium]MEC8809980.1 4-hydroxy-tetrahydrodipicolinate synthase [Pseudomonadota bacterium]TNC85564.1 MAG: 4-hydroxy-tetrahydrodipicolinate synthase [Alcanivorax sp.]HAG96718.1 4-hydroxy-tetrahydrodipicolinate synthase [Gammaproteobacteria bacterium]MAQ26290.1 4-hydroxy-tetrahydrodipicolinate synthase [Pseudomonadales bacterium]|tara:strand:+ start:5670 stop:6545 length:876 start_codon:yes stop_codon:yes gene_type:complete
MITGSLVALVTPMHADGSIHWEALANLIDMHIEQGSNGIVAVGTTGESATLDVDEHCAVIKFTVERSAGRIPIVAGTGANCTREAIELTRAAKQAGADACLLVAPYYNKPTQEGLYRHHMAIADAVEIPQILYNVPGRTVCDMLPATVQRISTHPNVVAIKEATGNLQRGREILELCDPEFLLYSGDDATAMELMLLGAKGNISVTANVAPKAMSDMCAAAIAGDRARAEAINEPLLGLHQNLFLEANPIPVKWALQQMGLMEEGIRLPLTPLSEQFHQPLRDAMQQAGLL